MKDVKMLQEEMEKLDILIDEAATGDPKKMGSLMDKRQQLEDRLNLLLYKKLPDEEEDI